MKPILLVSTELGVGGAEKALTEIALRLPGLGFEPTVISLQPRPTSSHEALVVRLEEAHLPVRFLDLKRPTQFLSGVRELRRIIDEKGTSRVLSFLFHANVLTSFAVSMRRNVRHFAGIRVAEPSTWRNRLESWSLSRSAGVICVSETVKRNFARYFHDEQRLSVIPNGVAPWVEVPPIDLATIGIANSDPVILFAGRLHPQKGLDWALPYVGQVLDLTGNAHFVILGDGPQSESLERLALGHPYSDRVHFLGFQKEIRGYLARARCLLLPSRWEGMPNVVLEAIAAGVPVLSSRESSAGEIFNEEADSQLFAFGNGEELVNKLSLLMQSDELAKRISAANRDRSANFSWDAVAAEYARRFSEAV